MSYTTLTTFLQLASLANAIALHPSHNLASQQASKRQSTGTGTCTDLHMFIGRGWDEEYPGRNQNLINVICGLVSSCDYEDLLYDSTNPVDYSTSVEAGRVSGVGQITTYNEKCPNASLVLSGYSECANTVANILADSGVVPTALPGSAISAVLLFGDPTHVANKSYNVESGSQYSGEMNRTAESQANLDTFSGVLRSYCQDLDEVCSEGDGTRTYDTDTYHTNYFDLFSDEAGAWAVSMTGLPVTNTTTTTSDVCVEGTVADGISQNYLGLCVFSCQYGYCPPDVCTCSRYGTVVDEPAFNGTTDGCPADGLDDSYLGLCSFDCTHGYCPSGACQTC
ncbi:unnamed protein product [Discula destructiva]